MTDKLYKVLIVDDELLIRQGIINFINWEEEGYQIIGEASNGKEAMQIIEKSRPHIIITDIVMPEVDGIELVKSVKERYPEIEIIVLSSFEDFHYVKSTFQNGVADYILKPKLNARELLTTLNNITFRKMDPMSLKKATITIEEKLYRLLQGYQSTDNIEGYFPYGQYKLIEFFWNKPLDNLPVIQSLLTKVTDKNKKFICYTIFNSDNQLVCIGNYQVNQLAVFKQQLHDLLAEIEPGIKVVMSSTFHSIAEMKKVYEEDHQELKQYLFYLPDLPMLTYEEIPEVKSNKTQFDLNEFILLFKRRQFEGAINYLNNHVSLLTKQYDMDVFEFKSWLENIIFNISVLLDNMKYETDILESQKYQYFNEINEAFDVREALSSFYDFLAKVETLVFENIDNSPKIEKLLSYMEEHYMEHLTLSRLADHFHFNPSYISSYFSSHYREGFSEYLNNLRISKAKEMLATTRMSIATISELVGFSDQSYFCRVFKKNTGKSPSNYRKEHK
ncbi:response regulator transcription factor [Gracilibacillus oryzae]|uniref:Response regulator transcription factor n=1 Tax=Gracilibacillus oryzae TaxID=1672701 RepID=A0A7C8GSE6_9BACI|nr:response regulator transcription factor [Gracilibacillus oryzae]KAB8128068.1 response regulator transcription factor [Gracilibacillus oryzae]